MARALSRRCLDAARRLRSGSDREALHDLRVGLRRLRVTLKAYDRWLGASSARRRRRLRRVSRLAGQARDDEVLAAWLRSTGEDGRAVRSLEDRVRRRRLRVARKARRILAPLDAGPPAGAEGPAPRFGEAAAGPLLDAAAALERSFGRLGRARARAVHRARIDSKRLRYLLEPFAEAGPLVERLRGLQAALGYLHDAGLWETEAPSGRARRRAAAERRRLEARLLARRPRVRAAALAAGVRRLAVHIARPA